MHESGRLVLEEQLVDVRGWSPGMQEETAPKFLASFDARGWFMGAWDGDDLAGIAVVEVGPFGPGADMVQLSFLHVSRPYRGTGVGASLFRRAKAESAARGAKRMYVSASATERTVRFYLSLGCELLAEPDPALFALEPTDIHLACAVP